MNIAVEGCSHGELDVIFAAVEHAKQSSGLSIDLLICCGDFQSVRNLGDLRCMAAPIKYLNIQTFYKYYSGEKVAPVLTIFIGGNHEASNYLQELPYGGWVAPNIYFLGYGGVINVGGLRIGGISGIYKGIDYLKGRYERPPYTESSIRSVYHVRNLEVFRMKQLDKTAAPLDIFLSHDWPRGVTQFGDANKLVRQKPFFKDEVESNTLGSKPAQELLHYLQPRYWFAGHLHIKFVALVDHGQAPKSSEFNEGKNCLESQRFTRFIALDKCLPRREFLQVLNVKCGLQHRHQNLQMETSSPCHESEMESSEKMQKKQETLYSYPLHDDNGCIQLYHDLEWLTILRLTDHLLQVTPNAVYMPGPGNSSERFNFTPTQEDLEETLKLMKNDLRICPDQFCRTADAFNPESDALLMEHIATVEQPEPVMNPFTAELCEKLRIRDPMAVLLKCAHGKSPFVLRTPKKGCSSDVNESLDSSRLTYDDPGSDVDSSSGDIVFEVSISNNNDGTAEGTLSPALNPARAVPRRALVLGAPQNTADSDSEFPCSANSAEAKPSSSASPATDSTSAAGQFLKMNR
ncbi:hypothetical protein HAZT_HAZT009385 [Hyalella azteca]|uniref:Lariat debranching enzyme C-terminal domain-containing protein n=1 Tax=Hyalella azteca TaxID=294128 RepID=A0A6A0H7N3_HYAAZ|nr:hypothetical protein HAZT_HAZT009385 [Hyalella azteca]